jgi:nucleotide-binding universal stress UspA family protein
MRDGWSTIPAQDGRSHLRKGAAMNASRCLLLAIDNSEGTDRAVNYVATIIDGQPGFRICLFHVSVSLPPSLLEFGGAENPEEEERREAALRGARTQWIARANAYAEGIFARAQSILRAAGVPAQAVETQLATPLNSEGGVTTILEAARANQCGTVVVGRQSFSWLQELFQHHIGEELIRRGQDSPSGSSSRRRRGDRDSASERVFCGSRPRPQIRCLNTIIP